MKYRQWVVRLADHLDVGIVESSSPLAVDVDFHVGVEWLTWITFELIGEQNQAVDGNTNMTDRRPRHRPDPTVDVLAFRLSLFLKGQILFNRVILRFFGTAHVEVPSLSSYSGSGSWTHSAVNSIPS